jgi:hypothetical protein
MARSLYACSARLGFGQLESLVEVVAILFEIGETTRFTTGILRFNDLHQYNIGCQQGDARK